MFKVIARYLSPKYKVITHIIADCVCKTTLETDKDKIKDIIIYHLSECAKRLKAYNYPDHKLRSMTMAVVSALLNTSLHCGNCEVLLLIKDYQLELYDYGKILPDDIFESLMDNMVSIMVRVLEQEN